MQTCYVRRLIHPYIYVIGTRSGTYGTVGLQVLWSARSHTAASFLRIPYRCVLRTCRNQGQGQYSWLLQTFVIYTVFENFRNSAITGSVTINSECSSNRNHWRAQREGTPRMGGKGEETGREWRARSGKRKERRDEIPYRYSFFHFQPCKVKKKANLYNALL